MGTEFTAFIDCTRMEAFDDLGSIGRIISRHRPDAQQLSIRLLVKGSIYTANVRRRANGPSRARFRLTKSLDNGAGV